MDNFKTIDYRELLKEDAEGGPGEGGERDITEKGKGKASLFSKLQAFWLGVDAKTRRELVILAVIILAIAGLLLYYFVWSGRGIFGGEELPSPLPQDVETSGSQL